MRNDESLLQIENVCLRIRAISLMMCVCVFIKLHITAQSGLVILVILCHSR